MIAIGNPSKYNRYSYALNNPVGCDDPTRHDAIFVTDPSQIGGHGHMFIVVVYEDGSGTAYSWSRKQNVRRVKSSTPLTASDTATPASLAVALKIQGFFDNTNGISDIRFNRVSLTDNLAKRVEMFWKKLKDAWRDWYNLVTDNCADKSLKSVQTTGAEVPSTLGVTEPNQVADKLAPTYGEESGTSTEWWDGTTGGGGKYIPLP